MLLTSSVQAADEPVFQPVDSAVWQAHFEAWVETHLVRDEIQEAAADFPLFDSEATLRILRELESAHVHAWRDEPFLPQDVRPRILARGIEGDALEAARLYARGEKRKALGILARPELAREGAIVNLRAQVLDELTAKLHPIFRLAVVDQYRKAIRLEAKTPQADRARLRIGQIYLELGFVAEAAAQLGSIQEPELSPPYAQSARVSFAESAYLHGDPNTALKVLTALSSEKLSPEVQHWHGLRRADAHFSYRRYAEASSAYAGLSAEGPIAPLSGIRHGHALLAQGDPGQARVILAKVLEPKLPDALASLGALLLASALREAGELKPATKLASAIPLQTPNRDTAALASIEAMEAQRLLGHKSLALPAGAAELVTGAISSAAVGLLAYRVAAAPNPGDGPRDAIRRLGRLLATLPNTQLQILAQDDLTRRLSEDLSGAAQKGVALDKELLDTVESYLRPRSISENALLLAIESLARSERHGTCVRWARTLARREQRPLRRGLAAWREVRCMGLRQGDRAAANRLMQHADSGQAGPFALALATLAAESQVRIGDLQRAVRSYERSLQAFNEPALLGPVLLRLGELETATNRPKLALRRLTRGLALTDSETLAADPFRKAGVIALGELSSRTGDNEQLATLLETERKRVDPWWNAAYAYLLFRGGAPELPAGENAFARVAQETKEIERTKRRVQRAVRLYEAAAQSKERK